MVNKDSLFKSTGTMVTGTRTRSSEVDRRQGGWKILKRTCRKEEVIFARQWNLLKTGRSGRRSSVQLHCRQPAGEDGRAKRRRKTWSVSRPV